MTHIKIYKLKKELLLKLNEFIIKELNSKKYTAHDINVKTYPAGDLISIDEITDIVMDIPIPYPGSKKSAIQYIFRIIEQIKFKKKFIDLFSGSLVLSYFSRYINKKIEINCYEHNPYLINFYEQIRDNLDNFVIKYNENIEKLKNIENPEDHIKEMIKNITELDFTTQAVYYYIGLKVSFYGMLNYNKNNISLSVNKKRLDSLFKNKIDHDKLDKYSKFLSTINIHKINISNNYDNILDNIDKETIVYIDPPYCDNHSYKLYFGTFNELDHIKLKKFIDKLTINKYIFIKSNIDSVFTRNLYNNYNIEYINVKSQINKSNFERKEILVTNFNYVK